MFIEGGDHLPQLGDFAHMLSQLLTTAPSFRDQSARPADGTTREALMREMVSHHRPSNGSRGLFE
jgi:hypothetical protein